MNSADDARRLDWSLLDAFLAVVEAGSLLGAARRLGVSQPTLGRRVAELEQRCGAALFERTGRGLKPTDAALVVAEHARAMREQADAISRALIGRQRGVEGTVRISASQSVAAFLLPPLLAKLRLQAPGLAIELVASNEVSNLLRREADVAVRMVRPAQGSLVARRLGRIEVGAYAHEDYLRRHGTPRRPEDLLQHDLVGYDRDDTIVRGFAAQGWPVPRERFVLRTDDHVAYWQAVAAGVGIGFAALHVARREPSVRRVLPALPIDAMPVWLVAHREVRGSGRIRRVWDFLAAEIGSALAGG